MTDWLQNLKVGDLVVVASRHITDSYRRANVTRVTANFIVVGDTRYRKDNGSMAGCCEIGSREIIEPTTENVALATLYRKRMTATNLLREADPSKLAEPDLDKLIEVLREIRKA